MLGGAIVQESRPILRTQLQDILRRQIRGSLRYERERCKLTVRSGRPKQRQGVVFEMASIRFATVCEICGCRIPGYFNQSLRRPNSYSAGVGEGLSSGEKLAATGTP